MEKINQHDFSGIKSKKVMDRFLSPSYYTSLYLALTPTTKVHQFTSLYWEMCFQGLTKQIMLKYNLNCSLPIMWLSPLSQKVRFSVYVEVKWFSMVSWPLFLFHQSLWDWICQSNLFQVDWAWLPPKPLRKGVYAYWKVWLFQKKFIRLHLTEQCSNSIAEKIDFDELKTWGIRVIELRLRKQKKDQEEYWIWKV